MSIQGHDEIATEALRSRVVDVLDAGAVIPDQSTAAPTPASPQTVEQQIRLPLRRLRFVGTYADIGQLIQDLGNLVRQVRNSTDEIFVYVALSEPGQTITVHDLGVLDEITGRDIRQLRHLSISLGNSRNGPSVSLYISRRSRLVPHVHGSIDGPDEAPARTLRAAATDLLTERGPSPYWLNWRWLSAISFALDVSAIALLLFVDQLKSVGWAILATALVLSWGPLYLPDVELLNPGEKTRWSRWSRYIVGLVIAWLLGSLAIPLIKD